MIPVGLTLRNFLSYGEDAPSLDFSAFDVACITGRNGHGKSALFDAVTWALWGEARKASSDRKPDDGLLRIGATDMRVEFVFDLDGQRFRVTRSYRKTARSGSSSLELQVYDTDGDRYRSISESSSIRKTQARIDKLIRIGYDTFVNSAFILQGRVDEFTRRSPSERKAILSDILELSRYDELGALAKDRARTAEAEIVKHRAEAEHVQAAEDRLTELEEQLAKTKKNLAAKETASTHLEAALEKHRQVRARLEALRAQRSAVQADRDGFMLRLQELQQELDTARSSVAEFEDLLSEREEILSQIVELKQRKEQETDLGRKQSQRQEWLIVRAGIAAEVEAARAKVDARRQHWEAAVADLTKRIASGDQALAERPTLLAHQKELANLREQDRDLNAFREERDRAETRRRTVEQAYNGELSRLQVQIETHRARRAELRTALDRRTAFERSFNDARQHLETFTELNEEMERIKRDGTDAQQTEERLKERIEGLARRQHQVAAQTDQLQARDDSDCPLCGSELDEEHRADVLEQIRAEAEQLAFERESAISDLTATRLRRDTCRAAYQKLRDQVHELADAPKRFAQAEAELARMKSIDEDLETLVGQLQQLETASKTYETSSPEATELASIRKEIDSLTERTAQHEAIRARIEQLSPVEIELARLDELKGLVDTARNELPDATEKRDTAAEWLASGKYAPEQQARIEALDKQIDDLAYDESSHQRLKSEIEGLLPMEKRLEKLQAAERDLAVATTKVDTTSERLQEARLSHETAEKTLEAFEGIDKEASTTVAEIERLTDALSRSRVERDDVLRTLAASEHEHKTCTELVRRRTAIQESLMVSEKDANIYRELVRAFGRDGIQALLIDQAIPELQDEANRILSRLTDNGTQITLESLSELRSGGTKETLDIRISDELGERRYELYSGGEAFRVDFAIRIALSKLLAHRSGTPLQTLVIDEGFGTQDEEGLTHLIEAIQTISDEFEKVLVITHVDTIKSAFPVRIEVYKHPESGSNFRIAS